MIIQPRRLSHAENEPCRDPVRDRRCPDRSRRAGRLSGRSPARVREIEARIEAAAEEACRDRLLGDLLRPYSLRACIAETTETAMEDLQSRIASTTIAGPNQVD